MRILFISPPLYGLLYPVLSLAQAFRINGHGVLSPAEEHSLKKQQRQASVPGR
jgi:UDP:flavonoid glycosyltransferase YjiC (YdhE family)